MKHNPFIYSLIILFIIISSTQCTHQNKFSNQKHTYAQRLLSDSIWYIHTPNKESWQVQVPGNVFTDLWQAGKIEAPFEHDNELKHKYIENQDFTYTCQFKLNKATLKQEYIYLVFKGLDTYATVTLNGTEILQSENMFRAYKIDVKPLLQTQNHLAIAFRSATQAADSLFEAYPLPLPADNDRNTKATSVFTRKAPYQYGWDWGPRYVGQGIWQDIVLETSNSLDIHQYRLWQKALSADNKVTIGVQLQLQSSTLQEVSLEIHHQNTNCFSKTIALPKGICTIQESFILDDVKRWFPNGMGKQALYDFDITLSKGEHILWQQTKTLGFRDIELRRQTDSIGESFTFYVNGQAVYAKGANYIPQDVFPSRVKPSQYHQLLQQAHNAHFNMIRVWGGGIYEQDLFYDLCDSLGIMVWQDFMFACSLYPADSLFLEEVEKEATQQIQRLRDHASLALWCGNNEINELWHNWGYQKKYGYSKTDSAWLWHNYQSIFQKLLPTLVATHDSNTNYLESSPVWGWGHQESMTHGDSHYWGIWWGNQDFEMYAKKVPRFSSEFGFQSLPALNTILSFTDSSQLALYSPDLKAHQKSSIGNKTIMSYILRYYPKPTSFENLIYISQLTQAYGLHIAFAAQRSARPYCMGTLFWQLNDCWPVLSWSSIDYYGQQKALYYTTKRDFSTFLIHSSTDRNQLNIRIVSDTLQSTQAHLDYSIVAINGEALSSHQSNIQLPANSAQNYISIDLNQLPDLDTTQHYLYARLSDNKGRILAEDYHFFALPKHLQLPETTVEINPMTAPNTFRVKNTGKYFAYAVYLSTATKGNFSDNFFHLPAGQEKIIEFTPLETQNILQAKAIKEMHLNTE